MDIRQAALPGAIDDARELIREYVSTLSDAGHCTKDIEAELVELGTRYFPPAGRLWVAYEEGEPAGVAALADLGDGAAEMRRLYVRPAYRRRGVARSLCEAVIAAARADAYHELMLHTMPEEMAAAQGLYRDLGFVQVERPQDAETPVREMRLEL